MQGYKKNGKLFAIFGIAIVCGAIAFLLLRNQAVQKTVGIIVPIQHIAMSTITDGMKEGIGQTDYEIVEMNANGDNSQLSRIVADYKDRGVAIYMPIFTNTAQSVKSVIADKPIVFAAVTSPVQAGLLDNLEAPEGNITGVSDLWPIGANVDLIRRVLPNATKIGVAFDPGDASSAVTLPLLEAECQKRQMTLITRPISNASEIMTALTALKPEVDVLFTANDVTLTTAFPALVAFAIQNKLPLFAGDYSSVERGAIGGVGQNYRDIGRDAGRLARQIIDGKKVSELPVVFASGGDIYLNTEAAEKMGVALSADLLQDATTIYEKIVEE
jgi:putative ABC transport system substrate-binding protein